MAPGKWLQGSFRRDLRSPFGGMNTRRGVQTRAGSGEAGGWARGCAACSRVPGPRSQSPARTQTGQHGPCLFRGLCLHCGGACSFHCHVGLTSAVSVSLMPTEESYFEVSKRGCPANTEPAWRPGDDAHWLHHPSERLHELQAEKRLYLKDRTAPGAQVGRGARGPSCPTASSGITSLLTPLTAEHWQLHHQLQGK